MLHFLPRLITWVENRHRARSERIGRRRRGRFARCGILTKSQECTTHIAKAWISTALAGHLANRTPHPPRPSTPSILHARRRQAWPKAVAASPGTCADRDSGEVETSREPPELTMEVLTARPKDGKSPPVGHGSRESTSISVSVIPTPSLTPIYCGVKQNRSLRVVPTCRPISPQNRLFLIRPTHQGQNRKNVSANQPVRRHAEPGYGKCCWGVGPLFSEKFDSYREYWDQ